MVSVKWPVVLDMHATNKRPLVAWLDLGNGTMFRVGAFFITPGDYIKGIISEGQAYPRDGFFLGIERVGCFFFRVPSQPLSGAYVSEKMFLPPADANIIADWLNAQFGFEDATQQGDYTKHYIEEVDVYHYSGENPIKPLCPEILG